MQTLANMRPAPKSAGRSQRQDTEKDPATAPIGFDEERFAMFRLAWSNLLNPLFVRPSAAAGSNAFGRAIFFLELGAMRRAAFLPILCLLALGACAAPGGPYPSLQPRPAEAIDPRVPV